MLRLIKILEQFNLRVGQVVSWLTLAMVLLVSAVALLRYLFDIGSIAVQELAVYLHGIVFMVGAAYTLQQDDHVRVDIFYQRLGPCGKAWVNCLGTIFLLLPVCGFLLWVSLDYVATAWQIQEGSPEAGGLAWRYVLKSTLLLMPVLLLIQGLATLLKCGLILTGNFPVEIEIDADDPPSTGRPAAKI